MINETAFAGGALVLFVIEIVNFNKYLKEKKKKRTGWLTFKFIFATFVVSMLLSLLVFGLIFPRSSEVVGLWTWYLTFIVAGILSFLYKKIRWAS